MDFEYTPYYCEENIWRLCQRTEFQHSKTFALFVSSDNGASPLWFQRAAPTPHEPIVWDYHVIMLEGERENARIWDLDTTLGCPLSARAYLRNTFAPPGELPPGYEPWFRMVEKEILLETFASDRSHMKDKNGAWLKPPPFWPPPAPEGQEKTNLKRFLDRSDKICGEIVTLREAHHRFG